MFNGALNTPLEVTQFLPLLAVNKLIKYPTQKETVQPIRVSHRYEIENTLAMDELCKKAVEMRVIRVITQMLHFHIIYTYTHTYTYIYIYTLYIYIYMYVYICIYIINIIYIYNICIIHICIYNATAKR